MTTILSSQLRLAGTVRRRAAASYSLKFIGGNATTTFCKSTYCSLTHQTISAHAIILQQKVSRDQYAYFSGAASSSGIPPIDVTVTKTSSFSDSDVPAHFKQQQQASDAEIENTSSDVGKEDSAPSSTPKLSKSQDQITEEEILELQSELRTHHRHAAYSAALETATELLDRCTSHFGKMHPATASAYNNVGLMNKLLGNYGEAKNAFHESLQIYEEVRHYNILHVYCIERRLLSSSSCSPLQSFSHTDCWKGS